MSLRPTFAVLLCSGLAACADEPCEPVSDDERYEIYSAAVREAFGLSGEGVVLVRMSTLYGGELHPFDEEHERGHPLFESIDGRAVDELFADADASYAVDPARLDWDADAVVGLDVMEIPRDTSRDPDLFPRIFRHHEATTEAVFLLSPVGACAGDALVYVVAECGYGCTTGHFVLLTKHADGWRFQAKTRLWQG